MDMKNQVKEKKKRKFNIMTVALVACFVVQILFIGMLMMINILPLLYAAIVIVVMALIDFAIIKLMKDKKRGSTKRLTSSRAATPTAPVIILIFIIFSFHDSLRRRLRRSVFRV